MATFDTRDNGSGGGQAEQPEQAREPEQTREPLVLARIEVGNRKLPANTTPSATVAPPATSPMHDALDGGGRLPPRSGFFQEVARQGLEDIQDEARGFREGTYISTVGPIKDAAKWAVNNPGKSAAVAAVGAGAAVGFAPAVAFVYGTGAVFTAAYAVGVSSDVVQYGKKSWEGFSAGWRGDFDRARDAHRAANRLKGKITGELLGGAAVGKGFGEIAKWTRNSPAIQKWHDVLPERLRTKRPGDAAPGQESGVDPQAGGEVVGADDIPDLPAATTTTPTTSAQPAPAPAAATPAAADGATGAAVVGTAAAATAATGAPAPTGAGTAAPAAPGAAPAPVPAGTPAAPAPAAAATTAPPPVKPAATYNGATNGAKPSVYIATDAPMEGVSQGPRNPDTFLNRRLAQLERARRAEQGGSNGHGTAATRPAAEPAEGAAGPEAAPTDVAVAEPTPAKAAEGPVVETPTEAAATTPEVPADVPTPSDAPGQVSIEPEGAELITGDLTMVADTAPVPAEIGAPEVGPQLVEVPVTVAEPVVVGRRFPGVTEAPGREAVGGTPPRGNRRWQFAGSGHAAWVDPYSTRRGLTVQEGAGGGQSARRGRPGGRHHGGASPRGQDAALVAEISQPMGDQPNAAQVLSQINTNSSRIIRILEAAQNAGRRLPEQFVSGLEQRLNVFASAARGSERLRILHQLIGSRLSAVRDWSAAHPDSPIYEVGQGNTGAPSPSASRRGQAEATGGDGSAGTAGRGQKPRRHRDRGEAAPSELAGETGAGVGESPRRGAPLAGQRLVKAIERGTEVGGDVLADNAMALQKGLATAASQLGFREPGVDPSLSPEYVSPQFCDNLVQQIDSIPSPSRLLVDVRRTAESHAAKLREIAAGLADEVTALAQSAPRGGPGSETTKGGGNLNINQVVADAIRGEFLEGRRPATAEPPVTDATTAEPKGVAAEPKGAAKPEPVVDSPNAKLVADTLSAGTPVDKAHLAASANYLVGELDAAKVAGGGLSSEFLGALKASLRAKPSDTLSHRDNEAIGSIRNALRRLTDAQRRAARRATAEGGETTD